MKFTITREFDNEADAIAFLRGMSTAPVEETPASGKGKKGGKGKGKGKDKGKAAEPDISSDAPTLDDVRAALSGLSSEKGTKVARSMLTKWEVSKVSDIPEDKRQAFIDDCAAAQE